MFSDLARDDVFRIETPRLWLRWPKACDAAAIRRYASPFEVARWTEQIPHPYPAGAAESFVLRARAANAAGEALQLVIAPLRNPREPFGGVSLDVRGGKLTLGYVLAPDAWGKGFGTEAASAMVDAAFSLTHAETLHASAAIDNERSRRVLAKAGFVFSGFGQSFSAALGAPHKVVLASLERSAWLAPGASFAANALDANGARAARR